MKRLKMDTDFIKKQLFLCIRNADKKEKYSSVITIDDAIVAAKQAEVRLFETAKTNGRLRAIETLHPMDKNKTSKSKTNVLFNYILRGSWIPPHRHDDKDTFYYIISGKVAFLVFLNNSIIPHILQAGDYYMIEKGIFHSDFILDDYCYTLSGKNSVYVPETDKTILNGIYPKEYIDADGKWTTDWACVKRIHSNWKKIIYKQCCGLSVFNCQNKRTAANIFSYSSIMNSSQKQPQAFSVYCAAAGNGIRFFMNSGTVDSKCLQKITINGKNISLLEITLFYFDYLKKECNLPLKNVSIITPNAHNKIECSIQNFLNNNKLEVNLTLFKPLENPMPGSVHIVTDYIVSGRLQADILAEAKVLALRPMESLGMLIEPKIIDFVANGDKTFYFGIRKQKIDRGGGIMVGDDGKIEIIYDEDIKDEMYYKNLFQIYINLDNFLIELSIPKSKIVELQRDELISITDNIIFKRLKESHQILSGYVENKINNEYHIDATSRIFNTGFIELDGEYWDRDCGVKYERDLERVEKYVAKYYFNIFQQNWKKIKE